MVFLRIVVDAVFLKLRCIRCKKSKDVEVMIYLALFYTRVSVKNAPKRRRLRKKRAKIKK